VLKFILGLMFGITGTIWYLVFDLKFDFNGNISVNYVIACATCIATAIHFDSVRKQRKDRVWDINKQVLLDLTYSLSEVIKETEKEIELEYQYMNDGITINDSKGNPFVNLTDKIDYILNVYKPLMNKELVNSIRHHNDIDTRVTHEVNNEGLDNLDAYLEMQKEHKKLHTFLIKFISEVSGTKNT
jgi:hypothetical protein